ncbi:MAG: 5-histidylcysteine sulfoxide synthase [Chitinophagales bacterium]
MNTALCHSKIDSLKAPKLSNLTKKDLKNYFNNTWELYEMLFSSIKSDETLFLSPDPLRNPLVFYLGHTAAFYINKFRMAGLVNKPIHEKWDYLFAVGVDPDLPKNLNVSSYWPKIKEVRQYRKDIYETVHEVIDKLNLDSQLTTQDHPIWTVMMTLEHDRIHFETSSMLIRQLDAHLVYRPEFWNYAPSSEHSPTNEWIHVEGGEVQIGKPDDSDIYGWDNEFGSLKSNVSPFKATKNLISNADFLDFVTAKGYENQAFWTEEGWGWKTHTNTNHPKFWIPSENNYSYRAMFDEISMPMDWPVEVNAHEASAYCAWKNDGSRLLSEAEFLLIAREGMDENEDSLYSNDHNQNFVYGSPTPVGYMKQGTSPLGFNDLYGNVWDWLQDDFYPLSGFKVHPYYVEFSEPYMDKDHGMMAGASWATTGTGISKYYRLWFRRHFYQHAGFRLAKSL